VLAEAEKMAWRAESSWGYPLPKIEDIALLADARGRARGGHPLAKIEEVAWLADARELSRVEEGPWILESDAEASRTE
jgi:hypothetical protein